MRAVATGSPPFAAESTTSGLIERCSTPTIRNGGGAEGELDDDIDAAKIRKSKSFIFLIEVGSAISRAFHARQTATSCPRGRWQVSSERCRISLRVLSGHSLSAQQAEPQGSVETGRAARLDFVRPQQSPQPQLLPQGPQLPLPRRHASWSASSKDDASA
jgi:hypothetical protein